jgi:hypothetical protein
MLMTRQPDPVAASLRLAALLDVLADWLASTTPDSPPRRIESAPHLAEATRDAARELISALDTWGPR